MTSVHLLTTEFGRLKTEVGRIDFYAVPVQKEDDCVCIPPNIVPFADARKLSLDLARQALKGTIGRYEWRANAEG